MVPKSPYNKGGGGCGEVSVQWAVDDGCRDLPIVNMANVGNQDSRCLIPA